MVRRVFLQQVVHAKRLMHGKDSPVYHDGRGIYFGMPKIVDHFYSLANQEQL